MRPESATGKSDYERSEAALTLSLDLDLSRERMIGVRYPDAAPAALAAEVAFLLCEIPEGLEPSSAPRFGGG